MPDTFRARLERAFETLKKQDLTPILILVGSTGVGDWDRKVYAELAQAAGTPGRYVADSVGTEELGGGYWDEHGRLRYRYDDAPVPTLYFQFTTADIGKKLVEALEDQAVYAAWSGDPMEAVSVDAKEED